jgi:hypothetical protein
VRGLRYALRRDGAASEVNFGPAGTSIETKQNARCNASLTASWRRSGKV